MCQTATLSQGLNRLTFEGFQQSKYSYLRWGKENQALPVAKMRSVFVSVGEWRKKGRQAGGLFKHNFDFSHQQFSTGSSVGLATYPSSWTGGRVSKWMGGRKVSSHREQSVRQPKKDCDGKCDIWSVVQIFFVRVFFFVWVVASTRRVDVAGEGREKSAAKNSCKNIPEYNHDPWFYLSMFRAIM